MKKTSVLLLALLILPVIGGIRKVDVAEANPGPATSVPPVVHLSNAQVHASISYIGSGLWVKVDASYYMDTVYALGEKFQTENYKMGLIADPSPYVTVTVTHNKLEAYYPFPSDATNVSVKIDGEELKLVSRNRSFHLYGDGNLPELTWMISPVPRNFTITVSYEQPIHRIADQDFGEYAFLYSLGARFGLDDLIYGYYGYYWFDNSTAQFEVLVDSSFKEIDAYSIEQLNPLNSTLSAYPLNCTVSAENGLRRVGFNVSAPASTLYRSLSSSGAALFLSETPEVSETPSLLPLLLSAAIASVAVLVAVAVIYPKKRKPPNAGVVKNP